MMSTGANTKPTLTELTRRIPRQRARSRRIAAVVGVGAVALVPLATGATATAANGTSAFFSLGALVVVGDAQDNTIVISRNAAGTIEVNGGAVTIGGGTATIANTRAILVSGAAGNDQISLNEANGALPRANLVGGAGNDRLAGGSSSDLLVGQAGSDVLDAKGGSDVLSGGADSDSLTGGDGDDRAFGDQGNDRLVWNPGDDTDVNEGGGGSDTAEINGGNGAEQFTATANGTRVRFDRVTPAPFSVDIGTVENLVLNASGGDDSFAGSGDLATLIVTTVDGGAGSDVISGTNGADILRGGEGSDVIDGQQGNDLGILGSDDDVFVWDPGDGSDTVEGDAGTDTMLFNGSPGDESFEISAEGERARLFRTPGNVTMDTDGVEVIDLNALAGADSIIVSDLAGTDVSDVTTDLASGAGTDDAARDNITVQGTNVDDVLVVGQSDSALQVAGIQATITVLGAASGSDQLAVNALAGDDVVDASQVSAGTASIVVDGGAGNDLLVGGDGDDTLNGGDGDDVLAGGPGFDTLNGGPGDNTLIGGEVVTDGLAADTDWLASNVHTVEGRTVVDHGDQMVTLPAADLASLTG
jgi:Ca2+-binding RTX toxin-like protein